MTRGTRHEIDPNQINEVDQVDADEAGQVEIACNAGSNRNRGYYSPSADPQRCRCGDA